MELSFQLAASPQTIKSRIDESNLLLDYFGSLDNAYGDYKLNTLAISPYYGVLDVKKGRSIAQNERYAQHYLVRTACMTKAGTVRFFTHTPEII